MIYLDYNSHAPLLKPAYDAVTAALCLNGNPSSIHIAGRLLRKMLDEARFAVKNCLDAQNQNITFTSGASEANAQVIHTFKAMPADIFISMIEHDSIQQAAVGAHIIPVNASGTIDLAILDQMLNDTDNARYKTISVMAANNETGIIQPIDDVIKIAQKYHALVHVDATQVVGRIPVSFNNWEIDYLTCSSHKIGGPLGAGVLISRHQAPLSSLICGGAQEFNRRAGSENVPAIIGFAAALNTMQNFDWCAIKHLRDTMEQAIQDICASTTIHGKNSVRLANTACIHMPNVDSMTQVMAFDLEGIAISAGSACSSGKVKSSAVLLAMGCTEQQARESIRVSLCPETSASDIEKFIHTWHTIYNRAHHSHVTNNNTAATNFAASITKVTQ